jgi:hypothetical protein
MPNQSGKINPANPCQPEKSGEKESRRAFFENPDVPVLAVN